LFLVTYLTGLTMFSIKYRCVTVTQDAIYVLESGKSSGGAKPKSLVGTLPRQTQLGPVSGRWGQVDLLGERHWVHKRFHQEVMAADHEAGFPRSTTHARWDTRPADRRGWAIGRSAVGVHGVGSVCRWSRKPVRWSGSARSVR
jgi:hypothetical protein